ncbi:MAG: hypothetical protein ABJB66_14750 [Gemmatimonadaceae bacterium]
MTSAAPVTPSKNIGTAIARFTLAQGVLIAVLAYCMTAFVWTDAAASHAVQVSAWIAFFVQLVTFSICKLVAQQNLMAGWGLGMLLRFATVGVWGFLGIKALSLPQSPALISLATFFFVSTLIEPFFLNN